MGNLNIKAVKQPQNEQQRKDSNNSTPPKQQKNANDRKFKLPADTKTKVDPFAANYDTLRMMPDVDWEKKKTSTNTH
ncbi:unnamed protein product [Caenorhabditis bovis]|uniref:Uncharacterized protein n=1 Tax=Caenorhabditis bovis TaxID=2654633 RepID=A0A8S1EUS3_9PELO|nr:unnamed protein product [Caenorhabditis bovis]